MLKGRIININSTKYIVATSLGDINASPRGIFRQKKITPLVGDYVLLDEQNRITEIADRKNYLTRPNIANVDMCLIITSVKRPDLDLNLLDKLLVHVINSKIEPIIIFTKTDLLSKEENKAFIKIKNYYSSLDIPCLLNTELKDFYKLASGKVLVCCGQTGAGKSSFINKIDENLGLETKPISESLNRGVHTTRYVTLYKIKDFFIADTPGFSALDISSFSALDIKDAFYEFKDSNCQYKDCLHINTDGCKIESKVGKEILPSRYENYKKFIKEQNESSSKLFKKR